MDGSLCLGGTPWVCWRHRVPEDTSVCSFLLRLHATWCHFVTTFLPIVMQTDRHLRLTLIAPVTCSSDSWVREMGAGVPFDPYHSYFKRSKTRPHLSLLGRGNLHGPSQGTGLWGGSRSNSAVSRSHSHAELTSSLSMRLSCRPFSPSGLAKNRVWLSSCSALPSRLFQRERQWW